MLTVAILLGVATQKRGKEPRRTDSLGIEDGRSKLSGPLFLRQ